MLDELGPTFVKFGQLLSTRPDVVPPDIIAELRALQDDVRPFPYADVERTIQEELGQPIGRLFVEFDETPLAAASIGQVHRAMLPNGRRVVVKVQRPNAPASDRGRSLAALPGRAAREGAHPRARLHRHARDRRRVRTLDPAGARLPPRGAQRRHLPQALRRPPARRDPARLLDVHALPRADARASSTGEQLADLDLEQWTLQERRRLAYLITEAWMTMIFRTRVLPRRPASGEHPRALARAGRARRLRPRREADRRRHVAADASLHRRGRRERRRAPEAARRSRRALPEGARGAVRRRAARALLPLLRRQPERDRPDPGDPRGVLAHLPHEPAAADAVRDARQDDRDARVGRRSSCTRTSTCSRSRARTRAT